MRAVIRSEFLRSHLVMVTYKFVKLLGEVVFRLRTILLGQTLLSGTC